jgi:hypothetical protein
MSACLLAALLCPAAPPAGEPSFVAVSPATDQPTGRLVRFADDGTADLAGATKVVSVRDVISMRRVGVPRPPLPRGAGLITTTGDRVPGRLVGGDPNTLLFRPAFAPESPSWKVPVGSAAVVWFNHLPADTPTDPTHYPWLADRRRRDTLLFRNADTAHGTFDGFTAAPPAAKFKSDGGEVRTIPHADLAALAFNPALARTRKPKGPYAHLVLRDGTRLDVVRQAVADGVLRGTTLFGQAVEVPVAELVALDVYGGKATYLSDLKPARVEEAGFLGPVWPWAADRTVRGGSLRVLTTTGRETFDKGLGTHPRSVIAYDLGGKYRRFEAVVGLDPDAGGRAVVRVKVDGKEQPLPTVLTAGPVVVLRVDVTGAKELVLETDFGPAGDVRADVAWADARVIE